MAWQKQVDRIFACLLVLPFCWSRGKRYIRKLLLVVDGDFTWGGKCIIQCTDDTLWNGAPEICML